MAGLATTAVSATAAAQGGRREYYELRAYHLKPGGDRNLLENYLEKAAIPGLNRLGIKPVGVFVQQPREGAAGNTELRDDSVIWVLLPYPSVETFATAAQKLSADREHQKAGAEYLETAKATPGFERIDSWLMLAFAGMPRIELPAYAKEKKSRMFELRCYESYSEVKAQKKVDMFNSGEIDVMRETGLAPVFYGQALIGRNLPHLTYMLSAENQDAHKQHWDAFGKHPTWNKMKNDPQYADTVSRITNWFVVPRSYSQV